MLAALCNRRKLSSGARSAYRTEEKCVLADWSGDTHVSR